MDSSEINYIIFGASGDLAKRYLLPALKNMNFRGKIILVSRKDYPNLKNLIPGDGEKIFHLAIPPEGVKDAVEIISKNFDKDNIKIMLEKPFGKDLTSAQDLVAHVKKYFNEKQIYRVDHYLAKNSVQEIVKKDWDKNNVSKIEIIATEKIDIEGRVNFYEQTGALQDFVQSHLLELTAITLMKHGAQDARHSRYEALKELQIVCDITKHECVKRGQYEGYRQEVKNPQSMTETFVSMNIVSNDRLWKGVPIILTTGKALNEKLTQVKIHYKDGNNLIFNINQEPDAYDRVILAAVAGNDNIFISSEEVLESWRILDDVQQTWKNSKDDLIFYKKGAEANSI
ncbi:hypothetical protein K8Q98_00740 [Candidatus Nomurabacteria bacterium]|nr:hypothetical protein [Candidatus Nomurabacteria bacterium]